MKVLVGILLEERERLKGLGRAYLREIAKLPAGSIQVKRIKGYSYHYHVLSDRGNVSCKYLGKLSGADLAEIRRKVVLRKKYQSLLKEVRANQKFIERALRGKK